MAIDFKATRDLVDSEGPRQKTIAKRLDVSTALVCQVLSGVYPAMESDKAQQVISYLRDRGLLVERPEDKAA